MSERNVNRAQSDRTLTLRHLRELIAALDRRVPHVERMGESVIARDGRALRDKALQRIAELESEPQDQPDRSRAVASTQPRHDDIIIYRRFGEHASTHAVQQIYAVTYPGHTDKGSEHENYGEAEEVALGLAEGYGRSVWYEESPASGRRTLVKSFREETPRGVTPLAGSE